MTEMTSGGTTRKTMVRIGSQPIALAGVVLALLLIGGGSVALWRGYTGASLETDHTVAARQIQVRATEASEQLVEKTKALAVSQQESIDQLQALQEQMQGFKRLLAAQQNDAKRLSDQVGGLTTAIDGLRQSFASAQTSDVSDPPSARRATNRLKTHGLKTTVIKTTPRKRAGARG